MIAHLCFISDATQAQDGMRILRNLRGICNKRRCLTQQCCTRIHDSDNVTFLFEQRVSNFWREIKTIFVEAKIASIRFCPRVVSMERILNETILLTEIFFYSKSFVYVEKKLCKLRLKYFLSGLLSEKKFVQKPIETYLTQTKDYLKSIFKVTFVLATFMKGSTCNYKVSAWFAKFYT